MVERWYIPEEQVLTGLENSGRIPVPTNSTLVVMGYHWYHFRGFLRETVPFVERAFRDSDLSYKIEPYEKSIPKEDETSSNFLFRNAKSTGASGKILQQLSEASLKGVSDPREFFQYSFSTDIDTGAKIIESETLEFKRKLDEKGRIRTRIVSVLDRWDIGFEAGFVDRKNWVFQVNLQSPQYRQVYDEFIRGMRKTEIVPMLKERKDWDQLRGTEFLIFE